MYKSSIERCEVKQIKLFKLTCFFSRFYFYTIIFCFSCLQTFFTCDADAESADPSDECEC